MGLFIVLWGVWLCAVSPAKAFDQSLIRDWLLLVLAINEYELA